MKPCILLVLTRTDWLGTARIPRALAKAGFDVAALAPRGALIEKSGFLARIGYIEAQTPPIKWLAAVLRMVEEVSPRMIVPGDELALRLLFRLVLDPPGALPMAKRTWVEQLVVASLGSPAWYTVSIDKTMLPPAAEAVGVRVPRYAIAATPDEAVAHARELGWPVVLKRRMGFGGGGLAFVDSIDAVAAEAERLLQPEALDLGEYPEPKVLVQAFVRGPHHSLAMVAQDGRILSGFAWERFVSTQPSKGGQTSVLRFVDSPEALEFTTRIGRHFGISGFFNLQFILDGLSGGACLLEINRRVVTHMHLGERVGCDLGEALFAAVEGRREPVPSPRIDAADTVTIFPREWLRDPASPNLDRYPADIPWDEPRLIAAMAAMWRDA